MHIVNYTQDTMSYSGIYAFEEYALNLSDDEIEQLQHRVIHLLVMAQNYYNDRLLDLIDLENALHIHFFDNSKGCAGLASVGRDDIEYIRRMGFNIYYFHHPACREYILEQTIPHELAHLIAYHLFGSLDHGPAWKYIMYQIFKVPPTRLHNLGRLTPAIISEIKATKASQLLGTL